MKTIKRSRFSSGLIIAVCAIGITACDASRQARNVEYSGFLADYSNLMPGMTGEANRVYRSNAAKDGSIFGTYRKILIDPVTIYRDPKDKDKMARKDLDNVANNFHMMLADNLKKDYQIVSKAEANTLRLTVVITNAEKDVAVLDAASTILPTTLVASSVLSYAADHPGFSGDITMETRVTDAVSDNILIASVDRRLGSKNISADLFDDWQTVNDAIAFWSKRQRYEFCTLRGEKDCVAPGS